MKNLLLSVAALATSVFVAATPALATYAAQIEQGDIYWAKNVTKGGKFVDPASATCGDTVQFRVRVHNLGPDVAKSVNVKATLPSTAATSHSSTVTITPANGQPASISDTAGVNLDKAAKLNYIAGSTELLDANGSKLQTLGNTILTSGVNIGDVGVSIQQKRFVQFSVKTDCPTPEVKKINVCELATKKIITIKETDFDASKHSKDLDDCKEAVKHINVCELATKTIITINENDFDAAKHSKDLEDCVETPEPGEITVCVIETGKVVNIREDEFDSEKHTKDLSECVVVPTTPETPAELPKTGASSAAIAAVVLSGLTAAGAYFVQSRRNILG